MHPKSIPRTYFIDKAHVNFTPSESDLCGIELRIVNEDGTLLDTDVFAFNTFSSEFVISTTNPSKAGTYSLKIVATVVDDLVQKLEHDFTVELLDICESPILFAADQIDPPTYTYEGTAEFVLNPFPVNPPECGVQYTCTMIGGPIGYDLCEYTSATTTAEFNQEGYTFTSSDWQTFGNSTLIFEILGQAGSS